MKVSVIIPSLNPDNKLVAVVDALLEEGFKDIVNVQFLHMKLTREKEED